MKPLTYTVTEMVNGAGQQTFVGLPKVAFKPKQGKKSFKKFTKKTNNTSFIN
jgi:DNA topoisomerase-3